METVPSPIQTPLPPLFDSSPSTSAYHELPEMPESTTLPLSAVENSPSSGYPPTSPMNDDENRVAISTKNSPRSVEIMSEEKDKEEENTQSKDSLISLYTTDTHELGTQQNPINIDLIPEQLIVPLLKPTGIRRTQSAPTTMQCTVCARTGHMAQDCIQLGPTLCNYCQESGHFAKDCRKWRADIRRYDPQLQFCLVCNETGHSLDRCTTLNYPQ